MYRTTYRRNCYCDGDSRRPQLYNTYVDEPPVRDVGNIYRPEIGRDSCEGSCGRVAPERDGPMQRPGMSQGTMPGAPPIGPPPMGRYDLWDLRFDRWWGWTWVRRQQQNSSIIMQRTNRLPRRQSDDCLRNFCRRLCCLDPCCPATSVYSPNQQMIQRMYDTPSSSFIDRGVVDRGTMLRQEPMPRPYPREGGDDCYCPPKKPRREMRREEERQMQSWARDKCSSSSSDECPCKTENVKCKGNNNQMQYLSSRLNQVCSGGCCSFKEGMCCPCQGQQQNICCACAQNLYKQKCEPPKKATKKRKVCNCCTQTKSEVRDKNICTNTVAVSDACVCCKPKNKSTRTAPKPPPQKICCICKRPNTCNNVCPNMCCPCIRPPVCCPCNVNQEESKACPNDKDDDQEGVTSGKDSDRCQSETKVSKKCTRTVCPNLQGKAVFNVEVQKEKENLNWLANLEKQKLSATKSLPSDLNWINELLFKQPPPYNMAKLFRDNKFSSPLTGNTYNMNILKLDATKEKNCKFLEPLEVDTTIDEIKAAASRVEGDKEHRNLLTSVCDAILTNKSQHSSIECGDSSFMKEFTYTNCPSYQNCTWNRLSPLNLYNNSIYNNTSVCQNTTNNFSSLSKAEKILNQVMQNKATIPNKTDNATQNDPFGNQFFTTKHTITDPVNALFNERTQTDIDELLNQYLQKVKLPKFCADINVTDEDCQARIDQEDIFAQTDSLLETVNRKDEFIQARDIHRVTQENFDQATQSDDETASGKHNHTTRIPVSTYNTKHRNEKKNEMNLNKIISEHKIDLQIKSHNEIGHDSSHKDMANTKHNESERIKKKKCSKMDTKVQNSDQRILENTENETSNGTQRTSHCCTNLQVIDVTSLPIRSPQNKRPSDDQKPSATSLSSKKQMKRTASSLTANAKKKKTSAEDLAEKTSAGENMKQHEASSNYIQSVQQRSSKTNSINKSKSKIPIKCSWKFQSTQNKENPAKSTSQLCNHQSSTCEKPTRKTDIVTCPRTDSEIERLFMSTDYENEADGGDSPDSMTNDDGCDKMELGARPESRHDKTRRNENRNFMFSSSNDEIVISNFKYDSEDEEDFQNEDYDDVLDSEEFSLHVSADKSVLSIIKEETESDINVSRSSHNISKYLDINTSPFNFETDRFAFVDSCNSPFQMKKSKDRKLSLGLFCFSSREKDQVPYALANEDTSSSTSDKTDSDKLRTKEKRWSLKHN